MLIIALGEVSFAIFGYGYVDIEISQGSKNVTVGQEISGQVVVKSGLETNVSSCSIEFGDGESSSGFCSIGPEKVCTENFQHSYSSPGEKTLKAQCFWVIWEPFSFIEIEDSGTFASQETITVIEAPTPAEPIETVNPLAATTLAEVIDSIANTVFYIVTSLAVLLIMIGGFFILSAGGNPAQISRGKKIIIYTIIGFAIMVLARGIIDLIYNILGIGVPVTL